MAALADIDGDGVPDYLVGRPDDCWVLGAGGVPGSVTAFSGRTSRVIYRVSFGQYYDDFGTSVATGPDVDEDGVSDFVVGAPNVGGDPYTWGHGAVFLYSGATGTLLHRIDGTGTERFGNVVALVGDLDGDGKPDLVAAAIGSPSPSGLRIGSVRAYSSATGAQIWRTDAPDTNEVFGASLLGIADVNGDGVPDIVVGAPLVDGVPSFNQSVYTLDGATGRPISRLRVPRSSQDPNQLLGVALAPWGDLDGDGVADYVVGAPVAEPLFGGGSIYFVSSVGDSVIHTYRDGYFFGSSLSAAGDVDGDGHPDLAVGAVAWHWPLFPDQGIASVYSYTGDTVVGTSLGGAPGEKLGYAVAGIGDINGDGRADVLVGIPQFTTEDGVLVHPGIAVFGFAHLVPSRIAEGGRPLRVNLAAQAPLRIHLEGSGGSYSASDVVLETLRMRRPETFFRYLDPQSAVASPSTGTDRDGATEVTLDFSKVGLRDLLSFLKAPGGTATVVIEGDLRDGRRIQAPVLLQITSPEAPQVTIAPNPARGSARFTFSTTAVGFSRLRIFDIQGRLVAEPLRGAALPAGFHDLAIGDAGAGSARLPIGVYLYRLDTPDGAQKGRFVLIR